MTVGRRAGAAVAAVLAAGLAASLAARALLPLPPEDPLRGTLALLPLVAAGFWAIHRAGRAAGGRAIPAGARAAALATLGVLAVLALARRPLGLPLAAEVVAAGMALVLAHRVGAQLLALRPLLGRELPDRPSPLFFLLPLVAYLAIIPWSTFHRPPDGDEPYYLLIAHSLAYDLDADLTNNYAAGDWRHFLDRPIEPQAGDPVGPGGSLYSRHNEALPIVLAPAYRVAGKAGALATMAALTAALAWISLRLARRYWPRRPGEALLAWGLLAFAPPLVLYSHQVWVEVPAALLSMVALDRILGHRGTRGWGRRAWLVIGAAILLLPLVKIRFMLLSVPLTALAWWHAGRPRLPLVILSVALAVVGGAILAHNQLMFGNPLKIHQVQELELTAYAASDYLEGTLGLFWDSAFGLFGAAPLWLLLIPAAFALAGTAVHRRRAGGAAAVDGTEGRGAGLLFELVVYAGPYLLVVIPRGEWYGGWSPPFRYALIALPLLALALVPLLAGRRRAGARALASALGLATLALTLLWLVVPGWTYAFADGRTYLLDHLGTIFGTDVARLFPSAVRPRAATWAWPLAGAVLLPLAWWATRRRIAGAATWGAAGLLLAAAALPAAAHRVPTRVVELEDPTVTKSGGALFPDRWVIERTRYRGGWMLPEGASARAPVVPGGDEVVVRLEAQRIDNVPERPVALEVRAGDRLLATWSIAGPRIWEEAELGPFAWPAGEPLVLVARPAPPGQVNGVIVDRVELDWR